MARRPRKDVLTEKIAEDEKKIVALQKKILALQQDSEAYRRELGDIEKAEAEKAEQEQAKQLLRAMKESGMKFDEVLEYLEK